MYRIRNSIKKEGCCQKDGGIIKDIKDLTDSAPQRLAGAFKSLAICQGDCKGFAEVLEREFMNPYARPGIRTFISRICRAPSSYKIDKDFLTVKYLFSEAAEHLSTDELKSAIRQATEKDLPMARAYVEGSQGFPHGFGPSF